MVQWWASWYRDECYGIEMGIVVQRWVSLCRGGCHGTEVGVVV